jgi:hypothetical protein
MSSYLKIMIDRSSYNGYNDKYKIFGKKEIKMSKVEIIAELLKTINDSKEVEGMPYSTAKELVELVKMLEVA